MQQQRPGGAVVERMSVAEFRQAIRDGRFCPGDAVLYCYGRQNPLSWAIRRVQVRALRDLLGTQKWDRTELTDRTDPTELQDWQAEAEQRIADAARYTHAGMVVDAEISAEMTSPRARLITWERRLRVGDRLLIVRPISAGATPADHSSRLQDAAAEMIDLAAGGDSSRAQHYPWRELLTYWFSSVPRAIAAEHWAEIFEDHERNVCSGAIWDAWCCARLVDGVTDGDAMPESWYPGRMALDERYLCRVALVEVVAGPADGGYGETPIPAVRSTRTDRTDNQKETTMRNRKLVCLAVLGVLLSGCVAYRAPVVSYQRGPEVAYNQERSSVQSRATNAEAQVAETTAAQTQTDNTADSNMPSALDTTKQVGLKQGQAATGTQAQGREAVTGEATSTGQAPVGQQGGDALAVGQTPSSTTSGTAPVTINPATTEAASPATGSATGQ